MTRSIREINVGVRILTDLQDRDHIDLFNRDSPDCHPQLAITGLSSSLNIAGIIPTTYLIYQTGGITYAKNGITGVIDYSGTDSSTVINSVLSAMTSGGLLILGDGVFVINSRLFIRHSGTSIIGSGPRNTTLQAGTSLFSVLTETQNVNQLFIGNLGIDGNNIAVQGLNLGQTGTIVMDSIISNIYIKNCTSDGLSFGSSMQDFRINNVLIELCSRDGFVINGSDHILFGCESRSNGRHGYNLSGSTMTLIGCLAAGNSQSGMDIASQQTDIINPQVDRNTQHGIYLAGDFSNVIGGHVYLNNKANGAFAGITVVGNDCRLIGAHVGLAPSGSDTQQHQYNIYVQPTADSTLIQGCTLIAAGASLGNFLNQGTNTFPALSNVGRNKNTSYPAVSAINELEIQIVARFQISVAGGRVICQMKADTNATPTTPITGEIGIQSGLLNQDNSYFLTFVITPGLNYRLDTVETNGTITISSWFEKLRRSNVEI